MANTKSPPSVSVKQINATVATYAEWMKERDHSEEDIAASLIAVDEFISLLIPDNE